MIISITVLGRVPPSDPSRRAVCYVAPTLVVLPPSRASALSFVRHHTDRRRDGESDRVIMSIIALLALGSIAMPATSSADATFAAAWQPLRHLLSRWPYTDNFLVEVGNASGIVFRYSHGTMTPSTPVGTASTSKWPMAMAITGSVADGSIRSLDSKVGDYIPWWTKNASDIRFNITLRHLLSFTSGFGEGKPGKESYMGLPCMGWQNVTFDSCARQVHDKVEMMCRPGDCFSYNSNHLKLAGAMVMHATGLPIQGVLDRYLSQGLRMASSHCSYTPEGASRPIRTPNPDLAVCLTTTGRDYGMFLDGMLRRTILTPEVIRESERDYTPGDMMGEGYTLYGHYGFGHFLECFDSYAGFTKECAAAQVHCDPGAFGYYPLLDRRYGYWAQVVAYEHGMAYPRSGIPEYLRVLMKPYIDLIVRGKDPYDAKNADSLKTLSMDALDYVNDCYFHPAHCLFMNR